MTKAWIHADLRGWSRKSLNVYGLSALGFSVCDKKKKVKYKENLNSNISVKIHKLQTTCLYQS